MDITMNVNDDNVSVKMFSPVFMSTDDERETDFIVYVYFRRKLKSLLKQDCNGDTNNLKTKDLMKIAKPTKMIFKNTTHITDAVSCGFYLAELVYTAFANAVNVSGIINKAPRTGKAIDKIIYVLETLDDINTIDT